MRDKYVNIIKFINLSALPDINCINIFSDLEQNINKLPVPVSLFNHRQQAGIVRRNHERICSEFRTAGH